MSDSEDENGPPTKQEEKKWKQLQLDRERGLGLAFYYGGIPISLNHDEWLREERRKKRTKDRKRAASQKQSTESPEVGAEYNHSDGGSSDGSTGTLERKETNVCPIARSFGNKMFSLCLTHQTAKYGLDETSTTATVPNRSERHHPLAG